MKIIGTFLILLLFTHFTIVAQSFVHPGILHSKEDLDRMKKEVESKKVPVYSGYQVFVQNPVSQSSYKMQGPMEMVGRNPTVGQGAYDTDANAAHHNAIQWAITGGKAYADKAIEILNAWSSTLTSITGRDAVLMAGLGPFKMLNAAEILRYTNAGWSDADILQSEKHFKEVIYPVIKDFAPFANGNWDAAAIKTMMAIGVFCNDREIFERAMRYYVNGHGNGRLTYYVINEEGQIQESGRDQAHTQLGVAMLAECSEIAWHQGLNLYGYENNRLLKGFEYVAKFNLGNDVSFSPWLDRTGKYLHKEVSMKERGAIRAVYEQVLNHYVNRMGLEAPYTRQAAEKIRPEGPGRPGADHPGYGTLYFTKPVENVIEKARLTIPAKPEALIATGSAKKISLSWVESIGADGYIVKRSTQSNGPYIVIANDISKASYTDTKVKTGEVYFYTVSAANAKGTSRDAVEAGIAAGLPPSWNQKTIGTDLQGITLFNGKEFKIEGTGMGLDTLSDAFHYTYTTLKDDGDISAHFVPQPSSQFSMFGLMFRENNKDNSKHTALLIYPGKTKLIEAPSWHTRLVSRASSGGKAQTVAISSFLEAPVVTHGRLTGECWLKLQRKGNTITGFISTDGRNWTPSGTTTISNKGKLKAGLMVSSGIASKSTTVIFDQAVITNK